MLPFETKRDIVLGVALIGTTGIMIGYFLDSPLLMVLAGALGSIIGGFVGWLGGHRFILIVLAGMFLGGVMGYQSGDRDILIMSTGSGAAIAGFLAAHLERFLR